LRNLPCEKNAGKILTYRAQTVTPKKRSTWEAGTARPRKAEAGYIVKSGGAGKARRPYQGGASTLGGKVPCSVSAQEMRQERAKRGNLSSRRV